MARVPAPTAQVQVSRKVDGRREVEEVNVGESFSNDEDILYFAKITPALRIGNEDVECVHFTSFKVMRNAIRFDFCSVKLAPNQTYTLSLIKPVFKKLHPRLNRKIERARDVFSAHLFQVVRGRQTYLDSVQSFWNQGESAVRDVLRRHSLNFSNVRIGEAVGECTLLNNFFSDYRNRNKIMTLVLEMDEELIVNWGDKPVSTHALPLVPKNLLNLAMAKLTSPISPTQAALLRRFVYTLLNNCVAVDLLNRLGLELRQGRPLTANDFSRVALNWQDSHRFKCSIENFNLARAGFAKLEESYNEHTLSMMFWNTALNAAFLLQAKSSESLNFGAEWNTKPFLSSLNSCKVDYAALLECLPAAEGAPHESFPLLLVEYGKETVPESAQHKDFAKMTCMLPACCLRLVKKLIELKRGPELARVYGLLVGGTKARLYIAHPIITEQGNVRDVHINLSFDPSWEIDILADAESATSVSSQRLSEESSPLPISIMHSPTRQPSELSALPSTPSTPITRTQEQPTEPVAVTETVIPPSSRISWASLSRNIRNRPRSFNLPEEEIVESDGPLFQAIDQRRGFNVASFSQLSYLVSMINKQKDLICSAGDAASASENIRYTFAPLEGRIPASRRDSQSDTPKRQHPTKKQTSVKVNATIVTKTLNPIEAEIYRKASMIFPASFPRIYDVKVDGNVVNYEMEELEPLVYANQLHEWFSEAESSEEEVFKYCKFMLDLLFQLYLMHEHLGVVHSDISPANVMYSTIDGLWKLIDYDQAMRIDDSASTERVAGTLGYVAPECMPRGCFTPKSDVWSLGQLLQNILTQQLKFSVASGKNSMHVETMHMEMIAATMDMTEDSIRNRSSVKSAIEHFYRIALENHFDFEVDPVMQAVSSIAREFRSSLESSEMLSAVKPVVLSEKDPLFLPEFLDYGNEPAWI